MVQQYRLGCLFHGVDESKDAVATVNEWVTMGRVDFRQAQRLIEQFIDLVAKLGLNRIGTGGGLLDVERDDGPVMRQTNCREWFHQVIPREHPYALTSV